MLKRIISLFLAFIITFTLVISRPSPAFATQTTSFQLSDSGISYLKKEEGFSSKPYWDYTQYTVGYGSKCPTDKLSEYQQNGISKEDAEILLRTYITSLESVVNQFINRNALVLSQNQFDFLICLSYNIGSAWLSDSTSDLRKDILNGNTGSLFVRDLALWSKAGGNRLDGLVKRRIRDANMYLNGDYTTNTPSTLGYIYYAPNGGTVRNNIQGFIFDEAPTPIEIPSWANHEFMGWYTEEIGGQKIESLTKDLNGKTLYARWDTEEGPIPEPIKPVNVKVTGDGVNLREGCGTNYKIIGQAKRNEILTITETREGSGYTWGKSEKGWISLSYTNYNDVISEKVQEPNKDEAPENTEPTLPEATEHIHKYTSSIIAPICDKDGYTKHTCECGDSYTDSASTPLGHSFGSWQEVKKPTTTTEGSEKRVCSRCKREETRIIEKLSEPTPPSIPEQSEEEHPQIVIDKGSVKVNDYLAIRSGAGTNFKEVGQLYNGNRVEIYEIVTKNTVRWGKIKGGWICLSYVTLDSDPITKPNTNHNNTTPPPVQNPAPETPKQETVIDIEVPCYGVITVKDVLYVRWGPNISYLAIDSLRNGSNVEIFEIKSSNGMTWGKIGENRWINLEYVKIEEKVEEDEVLKDKCFEPIIETIPDENKNVELMFEVTMESDGKNLIEENNEEYDLVETEASSEYEIIDTFDEDDKMKKEPNWLIRFFMFMVRTLESLLLDK